MKANIQVEVVDDVVCVSGRKGNVWLNEEYTYNDHGRTIVFSDGMIAHIERCSKSSYQVYGEVSSNTNTRYNRVDRGCRVNRGDSDLLIIEGDISWWLSPEGTGEIQGDSIILLDEKKLIEKTLFGGHCMVIDKQARREKIAWKLIDVAMKDGRLSDSAIRTYVFLLRSWVKGGDKGVSTDRTIWQDSGYPKSHEYIINDLQKLLDNTYLGIDTKGILKQNNLDDLELYLDTDCEQRKYFEIKNR